MKALEGWLDSLARRQARTPTLAEALLTRRDWAYAVYRLRWVTLRVVLRAAFHLVEVILISRLFPIEYLAPILLLRSITTWGGSLWWGGLEQLRAQVRKQAAARAWPSVRRSIDAWLRLALLLAGLELLAVVLWLEVRGGTARPLQVFDGYALACAARLGIDSVARTYHAGRFALQRIYRPAWSFVLGDVVELLGALLLYPMLDLWGLSVVLVLGALVRAALTAHYTRSSYARSSIPPLGLRQLLRRPRLPSGGELLQGAKDALANATAHLDALLVVVLVAAQPESQETVPLAVLVYVLRPFLAAGHSWARIFYFDLKALELHYARLFHERFRGFLYRLAWAYSLLMSALVLATSYALWPSRLGWSVWLLLPLLVLRSLFALYQVQAFSYGQYGYLFKLACGMALSLYAVGNLPQTQTWVLLGVTAALAIAVVVGGPPHLPEERLDFDRFPELGLPRWLNVLSRITEPVRVGCAGVELRLLPTRRVAAELRSALGRGALTRWGRSTLLWFELPAGRGPGSAAVSPSDSDLVTSAAGCLTSLHRDSLAGSGQEAILHAVGQGWFGRELTRRLNDAVGRVDRATLVRHFCEQFPDGQVIAMRSGQLARPRGLRAAATVRAMLREIATHCTMTPGHSRADPTIELSVYCPAGEPELVFFVDSSADPELRRQWRSQVETATLRNSLRGLD